MVKRKKQKREFVDLTWNDLEEWAGNKILARGKDYQKHGHVSELARTKDNGLIAWVSGSEEYATKVVIDNSGLPESDCTCPYQFDCKHGVAVVLEYLEQVKKNKTVPITDKNDERFRLLEEDDPGLDDEDDAPVLRKDPDTEIDSFLQGMTKKKLIALIHELRENIPEITGELIDRQQIQSDDKKPMINRLRKEIKEIANEPGWQNYWNHDGYTPDYSGIRNKLKTLLAAGYADDVLSLGKELMSSGISLVEMSNDEGETAREIEECIPVIIKALDSASLSQEEKLDFAVDSLMDDSYSMFERFSEYLDRKHPVEAWNTIADRLINRLNNFKSDKELDSSRNYKRDQISNWAIFSLEKAGRNIEIIPLCEAEAEKTGNYIRLVERLIEDKRYEDAERWIYKGITEVENKWPGLAASLRGELLKIRTRKRDWHSIAAITVYEFIQRPSDKAFSDCKKTAEKVNLWLKVREALLTYLEKGLLPWKQAGWPLPETGFDTPKRYRFETFPMFGTLIDIAILEKNPEQVLAWYDKIPKNNYGWGSAGLDKIATAIQSYAPDRAVSMWKKMAENLIAHVNPKAYQEASTFLRKVEKVVSEQNKQKEWDSYIMHLRKEHVRKTRLIEVLDKIKGRPIVQIK
jgi:uncharacterized Zn finger protein